MKKHSGLACWAALTAAVVLLAACGGGSAKPKAEGSPTAAAEATARTVEVNALAVSEGPDGFSGEVITDRITVGPSETGEMKVSFAETEVGGVGPSLAASGWTGVALASLLLGIDPRQYEFTFEPGGVIGDGPSAGGLVTVALLAAMRGDDVREDAAMTGAVNPDGSVGPVGGVVHKIEAAAEDGKKLVLIPAAQRFDGDYNSGQSVDLVGLGEALGIEVMQVATIYEAYEELTGESLPRPTGVAAAELPADAFAKLEAGAEEWLARYQEAAARFAALPATYGYQEQVAGAEQWAAASGRALREGRAAVAYERALAAGALAEAALQAATLAQAYVSGGLGALIAEVQALTSVETRMAAMLGRLEAEPPRSAADVLALADAYANVAVAYGFVAEARGQAALLQDGDYAVTEALEFIFSIAANYGQADVALDTAENSLEYGLGFGQAAAPDAGAVTAMAETVRRAADANLAVIDALVAFVAGSAGLTAEQGNALLRMRDADFRTAVGADAATDYLRATVSDPTAAAIAVLGSSLAAWSQSALVVAKYYSLQPDLDADFNVTGFQSERSLADMLEMAEARADELTSLVADEGAVSAVYYRENARSYREGSQFDKITALSYNWRAALLAEALAYFTGRLGAGAAGG